MSAPSWAVVATVDEPAPLILAFAAYHLGLGASEIHLYFDRPNAEARALLADLAGVQVTDCDHGHWARVADGVRATRTTLRQCANANDAYEKCNADWLIHLDADEFLAQGIGISQRLSQVPKPLRVLRMLPLERAFLDAPSADLFGGVFRSWAPGFANWGDDIYGRFGKFLHKGFTGHYVGKSFVRTGQNDLTMNIHFAFLRGTQEVPEPDSQDGGLLHFDGLTPLHFKLKLLRRTLLNYYFTKDNPDGETRDKQVRFARNHLQSPDQLNAMIAGVMVLDAQQASFLEGRGLLHHTGFEPAAVLARAGVTMDLSAARFDEATRIWAADLCGELGITV